MGKHPHVVVCVDDESRVSAAGNAARATTQPVLRRRNSCSRGAQTSQSADIARGGQYKDPQKWQQELILEDGQLRVQISLYRVSSFMLSCYILACCATGGIVYILSRWFPLRWCSLFGTLVDGIHDEHMLLQPREERTDLTELAAEAAIKGKGQIWAVIQNSWGQVLVTEMNCDLYNGSVRNVFIMDCGPVDITNIEQPADLTLRFLIWFDYRCVRYIWNPLRHAFVDIRAWKDDAWLPSTCHSDPCTIATLKTGVTHLAHHERRQVFGNNDIVAPERSTAQLAFDEILHPFYIFQICSIVLWCMDNYYYYASCILFTSVVSMLYSLIKTKKNIKRLREMSQFSCSVNVYRNACWMRSSSGDLVPGDVFEVSMHDFHTMPCDAVLLEGDAIVNESMLTGESVPVSKLPLQDAEIVAEADLSEPQLSVALSKSFLFSGTKLVRVRGSHTDRPTIGSKAIAMVLRTGFNTTKGSLIRGMLFPHPHKFKFYRDAFRFVGVLAIIASLGLCFTLYLFIKNGASVRVIILRALDLITIIIPPALPATMSIGMSFALSRLKKVQIYCIAPNSINICGKVNMVCFDKTGTLTEEGLDVLGVHVSQSGQPFSTLVRSAIDVAQFETSLLSPLEMIPPRVPLLHALATCHSLKMLDGECIGDPLELKMFAWTGWELEESGHAGVAGDMPYANIVPTCVRPRGVPIYSENESKLSVPTAKEGISTIEFGILKTFEFSSTLRRMTVLVKQLNGSSIDVFAKGAPEVMRDICAKDTLPNDFDETLSRLTNKGYRVIGVAVKSLPHTSFHKAQKFTRVDIETNLEFLGFLVFENKLKPGSTSAVSHLSAAKIRQVMCTGDNVLTAVSVSRECGIVNADDNVFVGRIVEAGIDMNECESHISWELSDNSQVRLDPCSLRYADGTVSVAHTGTHYHLAVTGDVFSWMVAYAAKDVFYRMMYKAQIFARMSPDEKQEMVEKYQDMGYCVAFCGDGTNDCGALKAADVGLSLSEAEASVAAPFTSKASDIHCMLDLIKEGRAALVTSFSCFKYMALYSFIQFTSVTALYTIASNLGDAQFLYIDLVLILPLAIFMGRAEAFPTIVPKRPTANLLSKKVLTSLIGHTIIQLWFQILAMYYSKKADWYSPPHVNPDEREIMCIENTTLFWVSSFQYITMAIVFNVGPPYRRSMFTSVWFIGTVITLILMNIIMVTSSIPWLTTLMDFAEISMPFRWSILFLSFIHFIVCWIVEKHVVIGLSGWIVHIFKSITYKCLSQEARYRRLQTDVNGQKMFKRVAQEFS